MHGVPGLGDWGHVKSIHGPIKEQAREKYCQMTQQIQGTLFFFLKCTSAVDAYNLSKIPNSLW